MYLFCSLVLFCLQKKKSYVKAKTCLYLKQIIKEEFILLNLF